MRRHRLAPPRAAVAAPESSVERLFPSEPLGGGGAPRGTRLVRGAGAPPAVAPPGRDRLAAPSPARRRLRRLFDPVTGWFRTAEREANVFLSRHVFPRVPGLNRPYSRQLERSLTVSEASIDLPGLAPQLDGARLLLITDVHAGPFVSAASLRRTFRRLATLRPDAVLLGGDLTTTSVREFTESAAAYDELQAPLGVFAVLGNHDHYTEDVARLAREIDQVGITLLTNTAVALERRGARLLLAGIDDYNHGAPDLDTALAHAKELQNDPASPVVLLSHNPDVFFEAARRGVSLVLAGHTHAGQVRIPGLPVLVRMSRYGLDQGRYRYESSELVVSRGLGSVGAPLRVACPPEAVLVELRPAPSPRPRRGPATLAR